MYIPDESKLKCVIDPKVIPIYEKTLKDHSN